MTPSTVLAKKLNSTMPPFFSQDHASGILRARKAQHFPPFWDGRPPTAGLSRSKRA